MATLIFTAFRIGIAYLIVVWFVEAEYLNDQAFWTMFAVIVIAWFAGHWRGYDVGEISGFKRGRALGYDEGVKAEEIIEPESK